LRQLRQPRLAEIVAASLRDDILTGKLKEGDSLPRQENLFTEFRVSLPAVREAMRILETEGLISVRRGNVGGAIVHLPTAERTAQMISMVLQTRGATPGDVSGALLHLEPICAGMCAAREDRGTEVVPSLREVIEAQHADFDSPATYSLNARRFHETIVERCGSETMIVVIGSLERIWSAHESSVWDEAPVEDENADSPMAKKTRRAALRDHEKMLAAIESGNQDRAVSLASAHLTATRSSTLASNTHQTINANLVGGINMAGRRPAR
jgi:GntR family transcriptional regulator, transcriptional repressor for pyruvate dehydrogenase complex